MDRIVAKAQLGMKQAEGTDSRRGRRVTEEAFRTACQEVLMAVDLDTETAAQMIGALAALLHIIRNQGGGSGELYVHGGANNGHKVVWHTPEVGVRRKFHRKHS